MTPACAKSLSGTRRDASAGRRSLTKAAGDSQLGCWLVYELEAGSSRSPCPNLTGSESGELWGECPRYPWQALLGKEGRSEERQGRLGGLGAEPLRDYCRGPPLPGGRKSVEPM